jgi:hypothetical protein
LAVIRDAGIDPGVRVTRVIDEPGLIHHVEVEAILDPQGVSIIDTVPVSPRDTIDLGDLVTFGEGFESNHSVPVNG